MALCQSMDTNFADHVLNADKKLDMMDGGLILLEDFGVVT